MRRRWSLWIIVMMVFTVLAEPAMGAIIRLAGGKRRASPLGTYRIVRTAGQRQILITIDPWETQDFQLDMFYPADLVAPAGFNGFNADLAGPAITYEGPYQAAGVRPPQVLQSGIGGVISNCAGQAAPGTPPAALANNGAGGSNLFTLTFIDNAPRQAKVFTIMGAGAQGVDPTYLPFVADNFITARLNDPNDPLNGELFRFDADQIDLANIVVPGEDENGNPIPIPLPGALAMGGVLAAAALGCSRRKMLTPAA